MAFTNLDNFNADLREFSNTLETEELNLFMRRLGLSLLRRVVLRTPVGNPDLWKSPPPKGYVGGRARGNWQVAINGQTNEEETGQRDRNGGPTIGDGAAMIDGATGADVSSIHIFNNVPYIVPLEEGHSTQAPHGMLGLSILELREEFP